MSSIQKWGNSLAVRIPVATAKQVRVTEGTPVEIVAEEGAIVVRPKKRRKYRLKDLLKNCKPEHLHGETDFGPDVGREVLP
jgi:antitoxin MazE